MEMIVTDIPEKEELRFITAKQTGEENGELNETAKVDLDTGDTNDFEIRLPKSEWDRESIGYKGRDIHSRNRIWRNSQKYRIHIRKQRDSSFGPKMEGYA